MQGQFSARPGSYPMQSQFSASSSPGGYSRVKLLLDQGYIGIALVSFYVAC